MRAVVCEHLGPPDRLVVREIAEPVIGPDDVCIGVGAAGVNFPDLLIIEGKYQRRPSLPFVPGFEVAGEVISVGSGVRALHPGDRVMALTASGYGAFAERAVAKARETVLMPGFLDDVAGSALYTAYGTAYHALVQRGRLQAGETLVVLGATGGVGLAAVEIGAALGARVIAVGRSEEKLVIATGKGAAEALSTEDCDFNQKVNALTNGAGADVCLDTLGGPAFDAMSRAMAWMGRLLVVGFTSGIIPRLPVNLALLRGYELVGVYWGAFVTRSPETNAENFATLLRWIEQGRLHPHIGGSYPMEHAATALEHLASRRMAGKLVLTPFSDAD